MLPDRVSNPGPLTYESGALPIALRGPQHMMMMMMIWHTVSNGQKTISSTCVSLIGI